MHTTRIYDISMPLSPDMPSYPGNPVFEIGEKLALKKGDGANVSWVRLGTHTGTHVDAPLHFDDEGYDVIQMPMEQLIGPAKVIEIWEPVITREELAKKKEIRAPRVLFKTANTRLGRLRRSQYDPNYCALRPEAAEYLLKKNVITFGIDYLSMEMPDDKQDYKKGLTHHLILDAGRTIIEGCDLTDVPEGLYTLVCLPLKIKGGNGAPARTILMESKL